MQSSIFYFAHFAHILLLFSGTNETVPMDDIKTAYCRDQPKMDILGSQDVGEKTRVYFAYLGSNYVVTRKGGPRKSAEDVEINVAKTIPESFSNRYFFVGNLKGYVAKTGQKWPFMGYNQDWIGCPQSLCMDAYLDAAADNAMDKNVVFFSGAFFWKSNNERPALSLTEAVEIEGQKYVDGAFCNLYACYLVKGGEAFKVENEKMNTVNEDSRLLHDTCADRTTRAVAATRKTLAVFLETRYCQRELGTFIHTVKSQDLPQELHDLDAAFVRGDQLHLVKQWTYFKVPVKNIDVDKQLTEVGEASSAFDELFGCQDFDYVSSSSLTKQEYRQKMEPLVKGMTEEEWKGKKLVPDSTTEPGTEAEKQKETSSSSTEIIIAVVAVLVIALLAVVAATAFIIWQKKPNEHRSKSKKANQKRANSQISRSQLDSQSRTNSTAGHGSLRR